MDYFRSAYKVWKETQEVPLSGTPIKNWPALSLSQVTNILSANIRTVEDLACANEDALAHIGMGGRALKAKAIAWLSTASDTGKIAEENAAMKVKIDQMAIDLDDLRATNQQLLSELGQGKPKSRGPIKTGDDVTLRIA